jgi:thiamine kinase-like enzyme
MNIILNLLKKENKNSESNTQKYETIDCQDIINKNIDTTKYIKLQDIIKETIDLKIFDSVFGKTPTIIKIGISETIEKEYQISHALFNQPKHNILIEKYNYLTKINYFIKYFCYFTCKNNIKNIVSNSSVCTNDGDQLKILIMEKYNNNWSIDNFNMLKELLKQIIYALYISYYNFGFIHNDVHFGNFLIKKNSENNYNVVIIDFETSLFDIEKKNIDILINNFKQIINNINFELNIITNSNYLLNYLDTLNNSNIIDINNILQLIDNLIFIEKRDLSKLQKTKYDIIENK